MNDERGPTSTATVPGEQRVFLENVRWETVEALLADLGEARGRLAYDQGLLEIVSPSFEHDLVARLLGRLVGGLREELGIEIRSAGSTTLRIRHPIYSSRWISRAARALVCRSSRSRRVRTHARAR